LVSKEEDEGYRIIIEEHHDPEMLRTLKQMILENTSAVFTGRGAWLVEDHETFDAYHVPPAPIPSPSILF
jgi:hypothetical protein